MPSDWERVAGDPALLIAAREQHRRAEGDDGDVDLADRLWWLDHPGEPSPQGVPDPAVALRERRAALYGRDASADEATAVVRAEARAEHGRDAARAAALAALAPVAARVPTVAAVPVPAVDRGGPTSRHPPRPGRASARPRRIAAALVAALLLGAAVGVLVGRTTAAPSAAALAVFATRQAQDDRPLPAALPTSVDLSSTRLLGTSTTAGLRVYAARSRAGEVCLIGVVLEQRFTGACTSEAGFAAAGLHLVLEVAVDPEDDSGVNPPRQYEPHWFADGRFRF